MTPVGTEPISGWLSLTQVGWGTRLDLECSYAQESDAYHDPTWSTYTMYVHTADGDTEQVASWKAVPGKTMQLSAATASDARRHHRRRGPHRRRRHGPRAQLTS